MRHFKAEEFKCKCGACGCTGKISFQLTQWLDHVRDKLRKPVIVTSGRRCAEHNAKSGGSRTSQHLTGCAADIKVNGMTPEQLAIFALRLAPSHYKIGVGIYKSWIHIDAGGRTRDSLWVSK